MPEQRPITIEKTDWNRKGSLNLGDVSLDLAHGDVKEGENRLSLRLLKRPANLDHFITLTYALLHVD